MNTNNNTSQTLFRFATMRNAELTDPKNKERRFIFRDYATQKGVIDPRVQAGESLQRVCETISGLVIETEKSLKDKDPAFYDLAVWVARNKATATKAEFDKKINEYKALQHPVILIDSKIWDNLIYQVVTQKDFYAKETLMQYLHLNHILLNYDGSNEEVYQDVIKAKVVLPKELFKVDQSASNTATTSKAPNVIFNKANMKFAEAQLHLNANKTLLSELEKLESNYKKGYQEAYKSAFERYQSEVLPIQKAYLNEQADKENRKTTLENRIKYLTDLSLKTPEDGGIREEISKLQDELLKSTVPVPDYPAFSFEYGREIDADALSKSLSEESVQALSRAFGATNVISALNGVSTYEEINQIIAQSNQSLQQTVLDNTVLNPQVSASVGGVVVPVTNSFNTSTWVPFSVMTFSRNASEWSIMLTLNNLTQNIISGNYKVTLSGGTQISSSNVTFSSTGTNILFDVNPRIPGDQTINLNGFILQGEVVLSDGKTYTMDVTLIRDPYQIDRVIKQGIFKGSGAFALKEVKPEEPTEGNPKPVQGTFIPSGFGMKNIGIADYRKVEQSTYAYVEGDVAHIENIMAREYKERATRRLKRSESQTTQSSESEKEKLTDTTSTDRYEMQNEVAKILQESKDFAAQAGFNASWGVEGGAKYGLSVGANYATHNSKEESTRQAVTSAKDVTARALDRIVTKVKEERIDKILEEYEENNKHGFDNTKGNDHVVGVYRWVDKVVKNQIYNYGKRMMFEFMIPEPAKLHNLGMLVSKNLENQLIKPVDPRESPVHKLENFSSLLDDTKFKYWISKYNVDTDKRPEEFIYIGKAFSNTVGDSKENAEWDEAIAGGAEIQIPENYVTIAAIGVMQTGGEGTYGNFLRIGGKAMNGSEIAINNFYQSVPVSFSVIGSHAVDVNASVKCQLTPEAKNEWLQTTFNKIIEAYELELEKYQQALNDAKALGVQIKGSNPGFYRKIENTILRRNCISYMLDQNPTAELTFGKNKYYQTDNAAETFTNTEIKVDGTLDKYAAFVKFMEQAFEWEIMSYYFYPYYWGSRTNWDELYQFDDNDPTFRAFMQSGMARVIVTVRPGFEEAVRHFLATGQIWNGGEVPVIDDPLFLSIVDEMKNPKGTKEGEPWREKIPTSLTILQAGSIGLQVEKALPVYCEPGVKFDDNLGEMCMSNFELNDNQIGQSADKLIEISFNRMDMYKTIAEMDSFHLFPRVYECLGNTITVDRDASWIGVQSSTAFYKALADEISSIEGVEAFPTGENGLTFRINISELKTFTFRKPGDMDEYDLFKISTDAETYVKIHSPTEYNTPDRIRDKNGQALTQAEYTDRAPLSKFLIS